MITVRSMQDADSNILQGMIAGMIGGPNVQDAGAREIERYRSHPDYEVYVAEAQAQIVGFGVVKTNPFEGSDAVAELGLFQIAEEYRGKGIGTELIAAIEAILRSRNTRKLCTTTNTRNIRAACFWLSRGFEFEARLTKMNEDTDYYLLGKSL